MIGREAKRQANGGLRDKGGDGCIIEDAGVTGLDGNIEAEVASGAPVRS